MRKSLLLLLCAILLFAAGCTKKVVVIKSERPPSNKAVIVHPSKENTVASNNHLKQAKKFYYKGKYKQAKKHSEKAIEFNHSNWEAHYYLGLSMQGRRQYATAIEVLGVSLKYSPENHMVRSELHMAIGHSWEKLGDIRKASSEYALALEYNPANQEARDARKRLKIDKTMNKWGKKSKKKI